MKKYQRDLKFAKIIGNKKINDNYANIFKKAYYLNKSVFKRSPKKFKIIICDTEDDFKKESKYYYQKWGTATVLRNKNLITKSPDFIEKIGKWKKKDFQNIINHETNHVFWKEFYKIIKPIWLSEGLACYIGNNFILKKRKLQKIIKKYNVNYSILDYRYLKRNFKKGHSPRYPVWANFTRYIIKKYSVHKLIELMDQYTKKPSKENYNKIFKNIFKKTERQLFSEFLKNNKIFKFNIKLI